MKQKAALLLILFSCKSQPSPKEAIVERQKQVKIEMKAAQDSARAHALPPGGALTEEQIAASDEVKWSKQANRLQKEYDSLEVELKKY